MQVMCSGMIGVLQQQRRRIREDARQLPQQGHTPCATAAVEWTAVTMLLCRRGCHVTNCVCNMLESRRPISIANIMSQLCDVPELFCHDAEQANECPRCC